MIPMVSVIGDKETLAAIRRATGPQLRRAIQKTARATMKPTLGTAKAMAPRESGRLSASLKIYTLSSFFARRYGEVGVAIYPSNDFTFRSGSQRVSVSRNRARTLARQKRGYVAMSSVWNYAHIVETGLTRKGKRRARASWYLRRALESHAGRMQAEMGTGLMQHLNETKATA